MARPIGGDRANLSVGTPVPPPPYMDAAFRRVKKAVPSPSSEPRSAVTVAIGGGKGGVGKSVIASNLAIAMARLGFRTVLVDADLGAANLHTMFGIDRPGKTLQALVEGKVSSLEEVVVPTLAPRVNLVPGSGAVLGAANIGHARKMKLIRHIHALDADAVVIDCGAGSSHDVVDLYDAADIRLCVVAPQLTSMQNAYAFLKSAVYRSLRRTPVNHAEAETLRVAIEGSETERLKDVFERVRTHDAELYDALQRALGAFHVRIVGNMLDHGGQRRIIGSLTRMLGDFLNVPVPVAASIPRTKPLHDSVTRRRPFLMDGASGPAAGQFLKLAEALLETDVASLRLARRREVAAKDRGHGPSGPLANHIRAHQRVQVRGPIEVHHFGKRFTGMLENASRGGLGLRVSAPVRPDEHVFLRIRGIEEMIDVKVKRAEENFLGVTFAEPAVGERVASYLFRIAEDRGREVVESDAPSDMAHAS
ncbi:MAG: P-loop NTPase [Myxococcota bacterium]